MEFVAFIALSTVAVLFLSGVTADRHDGDRVILSEYPGVNQQLWADLNFDIKNQPRRELREPDNRGYSSCDKIPRRRVCEKNEGCEWDDDTRACISAGCSSYKTEEGCDRADSCHWVVYERYRYQTEGCYSCNEIKNDKICKKLDACAWVKIDWWYESCHECSEIKSKNVCDDEHTKGACYWKKDECRRAGD